MSFDCRTCGSLMSPVGINIEGDCVFACYHCDKESIEDFFKDVKDNIVTHKKLEGVEKIEFTC